MEWRRSLENIQWHVGKKKKNLVEQKLYLGHLIALIIFLFLAVNYVSGTLTGGKLTSGSFYKEIVFEKNKTKLWICYISLQKYHDEEEEESTKYRK